MVAWASNVDRAGVANWNSESWLGLFRKGSCTDTNACYVAWQFVDAGAGQGTVIFSQADYGISGEYDVRYFSGGSRNGQGVECKGMTGIPRENYLQCFNVAQTTSDTINVRGQDIEETEDLSLISGMEAIFGNGNRGRYHRTKLT